MSTKRLDGLFLVDRYKLGRRRGWNLTALKQRGRQHSTAQTTPWATKAQQSHVEETGIEGLALPESSLVDKVACPHLMDTVNSKAAKTRQNWCIQHPEGPYGSGCRVRQTVASRQQVCQMGQIQLQPKQGQKGLAAVLPHACPRYSRQEYRHSTYWTDHTVAPNTPGDIMWILNSIEAPVCWGWSLLSPPHKSPESEQEHVGWAE